VRPSLSKIPILHIQQLFHIRGIAFYETIPLSDGGFVGVAKRGVENLGSIPIVINRVIGTDPRLD
jgi:hypothetical protein